MLQTEKSHPQKNLGWAYRSSQAKFQKASSLSGTLPDLTYTPNLNFSGDDSFQFVASDGESESSVATVTITVNAVQEVFFWNPENLVYGQDAMTHVFNATSSIPASIFYFDGNTKLPFLAKKGSFVLPSK